MRKWCPPKQLLVIQRDRGGLGLASGVSLGMGFAACGSWSGEALEVCHVFFFFPLLCICNLYVGFMFHRGQKHVTWLAVWPRDCLLWAHHSQPTPSLWGLCLALTLLSSVCIGIHCRGHSGCLSPTPCFFRSVSMGCPAGLFCKPRRVEQGYERRVSA